MAENVRSVRRKRPDYRTSSGEAVPGVTTILGLRAKPALIEWAYRLGVEHPELGSTRNYLDDLARIGTAAHVIIQAHLKGETPDLADFTANEIAAAQVPFTKYLEWEKGKKIKVLAVEEMVVSDKHRYGGSLDVYALVDGRHEVIDLKTGKAIYDEYVMQVSAYAEAKREKGATVEACRILQIGRTGDEGFTERVTLDWRHPFDAFLCLRRLYQIEFNINKNVPYGA